MSNNHTHPHFSDTAHQTTTRLSLSLVLTLAFVFIEAAAGIFANSLALLTDAAHNLTDVIALGLSWIAVWLTARPANARKTYGYHRAGILAAFINSTTLVLISLGIFYEAYHRFINPPKVQSGILIGVGLIAVVVNLVTALMVKRGSEHDLNLRSAFVHLMGDVLSTIGAVAAGVVIYFTNANWLDPLVSVLIGFLILYNAWGILRETVDILLESTPRDVNVKTLVDELKQIDGVLGVHDLHIWSLTQNLRNMSAHVLTDDLHISVCDDIRRQINEIVYRRYNISHATLQLECVDCNLDSLYCDLNHSRVDEVPASLPGP
ncbi:MAG: cation diffusion facilitator family transporter [Anaerolineales bacterium]|nr:cation diffusion facilitator family transporter [Anaerolineales bacterium]